MPSNTAPAPVARIVAAFLAIYLIWGTTFLAIRIAVETVPPFLMAGLRFVLAGAIMLPVLLARGARLPTPIQWRSAAIGGGLMLAGGIGLVSLAERRIPSGLAALMVATIPLWITVIGRFGAGAARPTPQVYAGLGLGFVGAALLFLPALDATADRDTLAGMATALVGALFFAGGSVYSRRAPLPADTAVGTASEMLAGGALLLLISLGAGEPFRTAWAAISARSLLALAYLTLLGSVVGYTAYLWLLKRVEPAKVGTNFYVNPVVAVAAGRLVAGEPVTATMLVAAAVILAGVAVINTAPVRRREAAAAD